MIWAAYFICLGVAFVLGVMLSFAYLRVKKGLCLHEIHAAYHYAHRSDYGGFGGFIECP
jgi:hypothetical protein